MSYRFLHSLFSGTLFVCGAVLFAHTYDARYLQMGGEVNSLFYPRFLFVIWMVMSAGMLWQSRRISPDESRPYAWRQLGIATSCIALFLVLFAYVGFIVASTVFFILFAMFLGVRAVPRLTALAIAYSVCIYYLFTRVLQISLPTLGG